jgi:hypothetical protein
VAPKIDRTADTPFVSLRFLVKGASWRTAVLTVEFAMVFPLGNIASDPSSISYRKYREKVLKDTHFSLTKIVRTECGKERHLSRNCAIGCHER